MSVSRRDFLALLGTSVAAAAAVAAVGSKGQSEGSTGLGALPAGNWIVEQIGAVHKGAVPITLRHDQTGERLLVEACRKGSLANPVVAGRRFDLFLANNGQGAAPTQAHHMAAVRSLADHLDRNVKAVPDTVLTMAKRQRVHGDLHTTNDDFAVG
ncbi:MAG: hypothetical protein HY902_21070 [Deltaproteobacteria bacterium]|nr:hypothetical protein [Deltaproteobacteria bacterium]